MYSSTTLTRTLFYSLVLKAEEGISVMFSASENQSSMDSQNGGAYIYSIIAVCRLWLVNNKNSYYLTIKNAHDIAIPFMNSMFITKQKPVMATEKRMRYFPFAVKFIPAPTRTH